MSHPVLSVFEIVFAVMTAISPVALIIAGAYWLIQDEAKNGFQKD